MSEKLYQQVIAKYLNKASNREGWWCRIPTERFGEKFVTDDAFPHLGTLFGTDDCLMCYALVKMGVVKLKSTPKNQATCATNSSTWNEFITSNILTNKTIETSKFKSRNNTTMHLAKIGHVTLSVSHCYYLIHLIFFFEQMVFLM